MKRNRTLTTSKSIDFLGNKEKSVKQVYAIKSMALTEYINNFIKGKDFKQNEVAAKLEMFESQLSKWLSGVHNMTLQSILKLESACPIEILNPAIWDGTSLGKPKEKGVYMSVLSPKTIEENFWTTQTRKVESTNSMSFVLGGDNTMGYKKVS